MDLPKRKLTRLKGYDYSAPGAYFITICTKDRKQILSKIIVGTGILDRPINQLTHYGKIAENQITKVEQLRYFDRLNYHFSEPHSCDNIFVFIRKATGG